MADTPPSTFARSMDFGVNRVEPHRYGIWRYGVGAYSANDPTRFSWARIKPAAIGLLLAIGLALPAAAADSFTGSLLLTKPDVTVEDPITPWGTKLNNNFDTLDAAICDKRAGCTISGDTTIIGTLAADVLTGNGSLISGLPAQTGFVFENLLGSVDGIQTTFVLSTAPLSNSLDVILDGLTQFEGVDYTLTLDQLVLSTPPAADSYSFFVRYATSTSGSGGGGGGFFTFADAPILGTGISTDHLRLDSSSVTLEGPIFDQTNIWNAQQNFQAVTATIVTASSFNAVGSAFLLNGVPFLTDAGILIVNEVQASTIIVNGQDVTQTSVTANAPILGFGNSDSPLSLDSSSVTLQGNSFNNYGQLVQLSTTVNQNPSLPKVDVRNTTGRMIAMTRNRTIKNLTWKALYQIIFPGSADVGIPSEMYAAIFRSIDVGTCDLRLYDVTNAMVLVTTSTIFPVSPTNFGIFEPIANVNAAPALWEVQGQATDGLTECEINGVTLEW